jgi:hypothetical protein
MTSDTMALKQAVVCFNLLAGLTNANGYDILPDVSTGILIKKPSTWKVNPKQQNPGNNGVREPPDTKGQCHKDVTWKDLYLCPVFGPIVEWAVDSMLP